MKTIITILLTFVLSLQVEAQRRVDIQITALTSTNCQVTLYPSFSETTVLSNVVFTLRWRSNRNIALGNPPINSQIPIARSGPVRTNGSWRYQVFSGVSLQSGLISQPITINIPRSGSGEITIAVDAYVEQTQVNGKYYVSVGGQNVTGSVISPARAQLSEPQISPILMYYDPLTKQIYIKRDGVYYTVIGQRAMIYNTENLIIMKKVEPQWED